MPALEINIESYHEVPTDEFLSVKYTPANSQDPKGEKSSGNHLGRGDYLEKQKSGCLDPASRNLLNSFSLSCARCKQHPICQQILTLGWMCVLFERDVQRKHRPGNLEAGVLAPVLQWALQLSSNIRRASSAKGAALILDASKEQNQDLVG